MTITTGDPQQDKDMITGLLMAVPLIAGIFLAVWYPTRDKRPKHEKEADRIIVQLRESKWRKGYYK